MVAAQTPTLAKIKNEVSETDARALLYIAICEVCDFFNVGKNMNDTQIALTVDLIIERFWYFKLEEIKYCFRRAMMCEKLFDRLDGNIIIGWLREYDNERTEEAMRISDQEEAVSDVSSPDGISYEEYLARLEIRAKTDKDAAAIFHDIKDSTRRNPQILSSDERNKRDHEFKKWRTFNYLKGKK